MSIHLLSHVMRHSEAQLGARLVLFVLAEHGDDDGTNAFPTVPTIVERTRMSRRAVQLALRRLEGDGMIVADGLGPAGQTRWRVVLNGGADIAPAQDLRGEPDDTGGRTSRHEGGVAASPNPSVNPSSTPTALEGEREGAREAWEGVSQEMRSDALELLRSKRKVDGRIVTEPEMAIAAAALEEFNRQSGSDFGLGAHLTPIVGRVRERPKAGADVHVRLVQSAWRIRWWEKRGRRPGRPEPRVIYGNTACFERVWQDAKDEARALRELEEGCGRRLKDRLYHGLAWDELTAHAQHSAKEAAAMGLEVWDGGRDSWQGQEERERVAAASAAASNGNGHAVYNSSNFAADD